MNTDITIPQKLVEQTRNLLNAVRGSLIKVAQNLYEIKNTGSFSEKGSWGTFLEEELGMSESFASKLLTINRVYLVEGGLQPEQLEGTDYEKLYIASRAAGSVEERLAKAQTLTRPELKLEKNENDPHEHEPVTICGKCHIRL